MAYFEKFSHISWGAVTDHTSCIVNEKYTKLLETLSSSREKRYQDSFQVNIENPALGMLILKWSLLTQPQVKLKREDGIFFGKTGINLNLLFLSTVKDKFIFNDIS